MTDFHYEHDKSYYVGRWIEAEEELKAAKAEVKRLSGLPGPPVSSLGITLGQFRQATRELRSHLSIMIGSSHPGLWPAMSLVAESDGSIKLSDSPVDRDEQ